MSAADIPTLDPDLTYEECPNCNGGEWEGCLTCFDEGLVVHGCEAADAEPA